jgi:hypothetical protein
MERWLTYELGGFPSDLNETFDSWLKRTGRKLTLRLNPTVAAAQAVLDATSLTPAPDPPGVRLFREALPRIEDEILPQLDAANRDSAKVFAGLKRQTRLLGSRSKNFDPTKWEASFARTRQDLVALQTISRRVRSEIHKWVADAYHRIAFLEVAEAIFSKHRTTLDNALRSVAPDVLEKIPAIYDRLSVAADDPEAVSQAMISCRRMVVALADVVCPSSPTSVTDAEGNDHRLTKAEPLNRLQQFLSLTCSSASRRDRLTKTLRLLHDRLSAGAKATVSVDEAQSLFLLTYLTLGETASFWQPPAPSAPSQLQAN